MVENHSRGYVYEPVSRALYWLLVGFIAVKFIVRRTMPDVHRDTLPSGEVGWHLSMGAAIVGATLIRVIWRVPHAPEPAELSPRMMFVSRVTDALLYVILIAVPLAGWANASARDWMVYCRAYCPI